MTAHPRSFTTFITSYNVANLNHDVKKMINSTMQMLLTEIDQIQGNDSAVKEDTQSIIVRENSDQEETMSTRVNI